MTRPVHVVVVAFHAPELLDRTLSTLGGALPVTVVDNSSSAAVREICQTRGATYIRLPRNVGFAAGVNAGILTVLEGPAQDVLLLNPDAAISPSDVGRLSDAVHSGDRIAAVAPLLSDEDGVGERVMWPFPSPAQAWLEATGLGRLLPPKLGFATGAVLLLRWEALHEVGMFDERFFLYAEEVDWERRALESGWRVVLCEDVSALHRGAGTSTDRTKQELLFFAGQELYIRKWYGGRGWWVYRAAVILGASARALLLHGRGRARARRRLRYFLRGPRQAALEYM